MSDFFVLPEALMSDIWLNLPINSTVRFRCVSESWRASLSDPLFIYKNLTHSDDAANDHLLLVNLERPHYSVVSSHETLVPAPLSSPPEVALPGEYNRYVLSPPCHDLVCYNIDDTACEPDERSIGVWNLTTGETKIVPPLDSPFMFLTLGFGFDEKDKVYKIVQILGEQSWKGIYFVAYVYSLSSSRRDDDNCYCWRKVGEPNMLVSDQGPVSVYSRSYRDGTFFWGALKSIVSFDMSTEVFNTISVPFLDRPDRWSSNIRGLCMLKKRSMCLIISKRHGRGLSLEYEIWAQLELGVTESWTKLLVVDWVSGEGRPVCIWRNELVLKSDKRTSRILITDPFKRETKEVQIDEPRDISECFVWTKGKNPF